MLVSRTRVDEGFTLEIATPDGLVSVPAQIPGSVHTDLISAGLIRDIRVDGTEAEQEWIRSADS